MSAGNRLFLGLVGELLRLIDTTLDQIIGKLGLVFFVLLASENPPFAPGSGQLALLLQHRRPLFMRLRLRQARYLLVTFLQLVHFLVNFVYLGHN